MCEKFMCSLEILLAFSYIPCVLKMFMCLIFYLLKIGTVNLEFCLHKTLLIRVRKRRSASTNLTSCTPHSNQVSCCYIHVHVSFCYTGFVVSMLFTTFLWSVQWTKTNKKPTSMQTLGNRGALPSRNTFVITLTCRGTRNEARVGQLHLIVVAKIHSKHTN